MIGTDIRSNPSLGLPKPAAVGSGRRAPIARAPGAAGHRRSTPECPRTDSRPHLAQEETCPPSASDIGRHRRALHRRPTPGRREGEFRPRWPATAGAGWQRLLLLLAHRLWPGGGLPRAAHPPCRRGALCRPLQPPRRRPPPSSTTGNAWAATPSRRGSGRARTTPRPWRRRRADRARRLRRHASSRTRASPRASSSATASSSCAPTAPDGRLADFEVAYTFGVAPLQQYLIASPAAGCSRCRSPGTRAARALVPPAAQREGAARRRAALDRPLPDRQHDVHLVPHDRLREALRRRHRHASPRAGTSRTCPASPATARASGMCEWAQLQKDGRPAPERRRRAPSAWRPPEDGQRPAAGRGLRRLPLAPQRAHRPRRRRASRGSTTTCPAC